MRNICALHLFVVTGFFASGDGGSEESAFQLAVSVGEAYAGFDFAGRSLQDFTVGVGAVAHA